MSDALKEFLAYFRDSSNSIQHEGVSILDGAPGRGSGRYALGSGENPNQHKSLTLLDRYDAYKKSGMTDAQIAEEMGILNEKGAPSSKQLRTQIMLARHERRMDMVSKCLELKDKGYNNSEIGRMLGINESSVRSYLDKDKMARTTRSQETADLLQNMVDEAKTKDHPGMIDVGDGAELIIGNISRTKFDEALYILKLKGYKVYGGRQPQVTNKDQQTTIKVLCTPEAKHRDIFDHSQHIKSIAEFDKMIREDPKTGADKIVDAFQYPSSMDSKRIAVKYAEDGGQELDGTVLIRRNVPDLSLGNSHYAQVRILVDGTHYIKGMAMYGDDKDFPPGTDVLVNTNKKKGVPLKADDPGAKQVLKPIVDDPDNPFGSAIKMGKGEHGGQSEYVDPKTGEVKLSLINKRSDEGDWDEWSKELPAQFLAKQPVKLIKQQLELAKDYKKDELNRILELNNPTVKRKLLEEFANNADSAAVHLKAASLPRQRYQVILPLTSLKDDEVYAPNYKDGEKLALVRFPHGGTFEIPILTVNNRNREGKKYITDKAKDAIGITSSSAERLSGADFDGDTVMVIPVTDKVRIVNSDPLPELKGFDTKSYQYHERKVINGEEHLYRYGIEYKPISHDHAQRLMGETTNLIMDMTLRNAPRSEIAKATKHSMVIIDAEKHKLDWKQSEIDNDIKALKKKWQQKPDGSSGGASTLITRAKREARVDKRQGSPRINEKGKEWYDPSKPEGSLIWKTADDNKLYYEVKDPDTGDIVKSGKRQTKTTEMSLVDDANELSSGLPQEVLYADYANTCKELANKARIELVRTERLHKNPSAAKVYVDEVNRLESALRVAKSNRPRERQAQRDANVIVEQKRKMWHDAGKSTKEINEDLKKESQRALTAARAKYGAKRSNIVISEKEWEAIQAGAISDNKLKEILDYCDMDSVRKYATPRSSTQELPKYLQNRIKLLSSRGYTNAEIADALSISSSTVTKYS